jgi:hypothetical protein
MPREVTAQRQFTDVKFLPFGGTKPIRVVEFFVGEHGPFRLEFDTGEYSPAAVEGRVNEIIRQLRETGAIK